MKNYGTKICVVCKGKYTSHSSTQKVCDKEKCKDRYISIFKKSKRKGILDYFISDRAPSELKSKKYLITDEQMLEYADSPTGRVYIGVNKRPLQKVKDGFGYQGVLLQTDNREFIQCHICGKWGKKLGGHVQTHDITTSAYRKKFGLMQGNGLVSDATSDRYADSGYKRNIVNPNSNEHLDSSRANAVRATKIDHRRYAGTVEHDNKYGLCEKQLGFRLIEYIKRYRQLPSQAMKGEGGMITKALRRRHGSVNNGFNHYNLPSFYRSGSTVELLAPNKRQIFFNYNKNYSPDLIYKWMVEQCPALHPDAVNQYAE